MAETQHYELPVRCKNCGREGVIQIAVGQSLFDTPCPACGCKWLRRVTDKHVGGYPPGDWARDHRDGQPPNT